MRKSSAPLNLKKTPPKNQQKSSPKKKEVVCPKHVSDLLILKEHLQNLCLQGQIHKWTVTRRQK